MMLLLLWPGACIYLVNEKSGVNQEFPKFLFKKKCDLCTEPHRRKVCVIRFFRKVTRFIFDFGFKKKQQNCILNWPDVILLCAQEVEENILVD